MITNGKSFHLLRTFASGMTEVSKCGADGLKNTVTMFIVVTRQPTSATPLMNGPHLFAPILSFPGFPVCSFMYNQLFQAAHVHGDVVNVPFEAFCIY